jgi:hypothetical protein
MLDVAEKQFILLDLELQNATNPSVEREYAALVILKHGFPQTVRQNKPLAGSAPVIVKLLSDACCEFASLHEVRAELIVGGERTKRKMAGELLKGDVARIDLKTGQAEFHLQFLQGTSLFHTSELICRVQWVSCASRNCSCRLTRNSYFLSLVLQAPACQRHLCDSSWIAE